MVTGSEQTSPSSKTKSVDALRTIGEVAEWLELPTHVLRFWESKFSQIKPVRLTGSRRYYRPKDMLILGGIKKLLHEDGMTIKGVQNQIKTKGIEFVVGLSQALVSSAVTAVAEQQVELPFPTATTTAASQSVESGSLAATSTATKEPAAIGTGASETRGSEERSFTMKLDSELSDDSLSDFAAIFSRIELKQILKLEVLSPTQKRGILPLVDQLIEFRDSLQQRNS